MAERGPRLVVDALVPMPTGLLLVQRGRAPYKGYWALPGGFVDDGEDPEAAVVRELKEEAGVEGKVVGLVGVYGRPDRDPRGHVVSVVYVVEHVGGEPRPGDDAAAVRVFPLGALPEMAADHARIVNDWRRGQRLALRGGDVGKA